MKVSNPEGCRLLAPARAFVGRIDEPVERFGGGLSGGQHADVVDDDRVGAGDLGDDLVDRPIDAGSPDRGVQRFQGEPRNPHIVVNGLVDDRLDEVGLPGAGDATDGEGLGAVDPFQSRQR